MRFIKYLAIPLSIGFLASCGGGSGSGDSDADEPVMPANLSAGTDTGTDTGTGTIPVAGPDTVTDPVTNNDSPTGGELVAVPDLGSETGIVGSWQSECRPFDILGTSERQILAISDTIVAQDFYEYDGLDCGGVPRGTTFPLRLYGYTLGDSVSVAGTSSANAIDLEITQLSDVGGLRDGAVLGQLRYGLIGLGANGELFFTDGTTTSPDARPTGFGDFGQTFTPRVPVSVSVSSIDDFVGFYRTSCQIGDSGNSRFSTITVTADSDQTIDDFFLNEFCAGESMLQLRTPAVIDAQPEAFTTFFGDPALNVFVAESDQEVVFGEEFLAFDLRTANERYTLFALAGGDTLMRGDCVVRESTCKTAPDYYADMIDFEFNSSGRNVRIDESELVIDNPGSFETGAIAGLWDFSGDTGFFYQENRADGTSTSFGLSGESLDAPGACLFAFEETLTSFNDDVYRYVHEDEVNGYEFYLRLVVQDGNLVDFDPANGEVRATYPPLESIPNLPSCS